MRTAESPYLTDLFAVSARWLCLFGLTISLGIGCGLLYNTGELNIITISTLCLPALWNGYMSGLAIYNRRLPWHRHINIFLDLIFSIIIFAAAGGIGSSISWIALLPILTGAVYFEVRGAVLAAVFMSLLQAGFNILTMGVAYTLLPAGILAGFNLLVGAAVALLNIPIIRNLRNTYQQTVSQQKEKEKKAQVLEHDRMKTLFTVIETLSSTLNYQTVLETVLAASVDALGGDKQASEMVGTVLLFGDRNELEIHAARGFSSRDSAVQIPAESGILPEVLRTGETLVVVKPGEDPELSKFASLQDRGAAVCIPLIRSMNAYGVIVFAHSNPDYFIQERIESLQMLANQAVISLQNARLYQDLTRDKERIVQSQEEANKKLARNLHDGPTQSVSAIAMRLSIARRLMEKDPAEALAELGKIEDLARRTTQEIRHMLFTLRPLVLESEGLVPALNTMADKMHDLYQQKITIDASDEVVMQLDATQQSTIFFLAEEAVNNARKHAQAAEIRVRIKLVPQDPCIATLEIIDNGIGFDVKSVMNSYDRRGSLGMINLQERTELVNGLLRLESVPGKGTRIRVFVPLNPEAADRLHQGKA
jgi:signal transduction histidine kinase